ncbi:hypothetical protein L1285_20875 [Pseudoalteromonas sp. DL2-H2.2]|uniref:hypothetical protein n=1 Tax=Pseudoalteromonas sp. DL2-H2.2 TaxID=2908889 RepID=UPI001F1C8BF1|nr:hypothetical protein [Pseudoalteromonas sp. DL2-H2.2]MCF2910765.1 hypothetical protein [Pseudoalteromonas sp. DL2-H2.2]
MSDHVEVKLTGLAMVEITKTITLPRAEADALRFDDAGMQDHLIRHENLAVQSWMHVFAKRVREFSIRPAEPGYTCANHYCGWVGNESDKGTAYVGEQLTTVCPLCNGTRFNKVQQVVPRG